VPGARSMALSPSGTLFVGTRNEGKVYALRDTNGDGQAEEVNTIAEGLRQPNGVAYRNEDLYVAEIGRVLRYQQIEKRLGERPKPQVLTDAYPEDEHHGWKYIAFGPDGFLYVPVGAPCNVCDPENPLYSTITRVRADGSGLEIVARGVRNTVGFDWHPTSRELWFTDNGRDRLGDDLPADELNRVTRVGEHFGFPYFHQGDVPDPEFGNGKRAADYVAPERKLGPHVAALGMKFYTGSAFPAAYRRQILIAEHGSWNRSEPLGYRLMLVRLGADGKAVSYEPFVTGWRHQGRVWGRPVDLVQLPDGSLLVSDDHAGAIYRLTYAG
ncbi:MAG: PQQ-dependent sugar dehydrogenase, partial [Armatimonadetes bacterium]|nr:PQQ-dependent sugar dehydrogenase [Armatimonadota bacterium]